MVRRQFALATFLAGMLLPVLMRLAVDRESALLSLPLAAAAVAIGGVLWIRRPPGSR